MKMDIQHTKMQWNTAREVLRGKLIAINTYIKKNRISNNLTLHLKGLEKEQKTKPKASRRKEIETRVEINETDQHDNRNINDIKSLILEEINKIGKLQLY